MGLTGSVGLNLHKHKSTSLMLPFSWILPSYEKTTRYLKHTNTPQTTFIFLQQTFTGGNLPPLHNRKYFESILLHKLKSSVSFGSRRPLSALQGESWKNRDDLVTFAWVCLLNLYFQTIVHCQRRTWFPREKPTHCYTITSHLYSFTPINFLP